MQTTPHNLIPMTLQRNTSQRNTPQRNTSQQTSSVHILYPHLHLQRPRPARRAARRILPHLLATRPALANPTETASVGAAGAPAASRLRRPPGKCTFPLRSSIYEENSIFPPASPARYTHVLLRRTLVYLLTSLFLQIQCVGPAWPWIFRRKCT